MNNNSLTSKYQVFSTFHLKIVAMLTMLIDHIGVLYYTQLGRFALLFRIIGRISLPLFCFLVVEAIRYSKKPIVYLAKLLIMEVIICLGEIIFLNGYEGCIFSTLFIGASIIYLLEQKKWYIQLCAIIPFAIAVLCMYSFFPVRLQYGLYGVLIIVLFYGGYRLAKVIFPLIFKSAVPTKQDDPYFGLFTQLYTLLAGLFFMIFVLLCSQFKTNFKYIFTVIDTDYKFQTYSLISLAFILLYNGKKGYNSKVFKWASYLFYPVHLIIIYAIYMVLFIW